MRKKFDCFYSPRDKRIVFYTEWREIIIISFMGTNIFINAHSLWSKILTGITAERILPIRKKAFFVFREKKNKNYSSFVAELR